MGLRQWLFGQSEATAEIEEKYEEETRYAKNWYDLTRATITFADGDTESVTYVDYRETDSLIVVSDIESRSYKIRQSVSYNDNVPNSLYLYATESNPTRYSIANIEAFDDMSTDEYVDVAELEVEVRYTRRGEDDEWTARSLEIVSDTDNFDVTSWRRDEWDAHREE